MPKCISCGAEVREGEIFCPDCYASINREPQKDIKGPAESAGSGKAEAEHGKAEAAPAGQPALTPSSQKKVLRSGPAARELADEMKKAVPAATKPKTVSLKMRKGAGKAEVEPKRPGPSMGERAARASAWLSGKAAKGWVAIKRIATLERPEYDIVDWVAVSLGVASGVSLIAVFTTMKLMAFEWMLAEQGSPLAQKVILKGQDLGAVGYLVLAFTGVALLLLAADIVNRRLNRHLRVNLVFPAALAAALCVILLLVCFLSDGVLIRYSGVKFNNDPSFFVNADKTGQLSWAGRRLQAGAYTAILLGIVFYTAVTVLLAESRELPAWMGRIIYYFSRRSRRKKKGPKEEAKDGA